MDVAVVVEGDPGKGRVRPCGPQQDVRLAHAGGERHAKAHDRYRLVHGEDVQVLAAQGRLESQPHGQARLVGRGRPFAGHRQRRADLGRPGDGAERLEVCGYALAAGEGPATIEHAALETGRDRVDPHELAKKEHKLKKREMGRHLNGRMLRRGAAEAVPQPDDRALGKGDARYVDLEEALRAPRPLATDGDVDWFRELRETSRQRGDLLAGGYLLRNLCALAPAALETSSHRRGPEDLECRCM